MTEEVPQWLQEWVQQARNALDRGERPEPIEQACARAVGATEPVRRAKGVTPRRRKGRVVYEVRHQGRTLGTFTDFDAAVAAKEKAKG